MHEHHRAYKIIHWTLFGGSLLLLAVFLFATVFNYQGLGQFFGLKNVHALAIGIFIAYTLLVYPNLIKRSEQAAAFASVAFSAVLVLSLVITTGGFMSPYYPAWLGLILVSGGFGLGVTGGFVTVTIFYFFYNVLVQGSSVSVGTNLAQLLSGLAAAGFSFWLWKHRQVSQKTHSHVTELSQKLSTEQLKSEIVVRSIGDGVVLIDGNGQIKLFNPAAERITGWREEEAKGIDYKAVLQLLNAEFKPLIENEDPFIEAVKKRKSVRTNDLLLRTRSDKKLAISLTVSPILSEGGAAGGAIAVFRDISEEKAAQRQRDEFISTASHEMRTPVASIEGYLALAMNPNVSKIDENAQNYLKKAHEAVGHLGRLFKDLLSVTKLEDGKLPNNPKPLEITKLLHSVVDELQPIAQKKNLAIEIEGGDVEGEKNVEPLYYVHADPDRIREVITNLVDNAIKFTDNGKVSITAKAGDKFVTVGVHDQGIGIAPEDVPHLFQKFYRTDQTKTRTVGGTGLGLYISRTIVEMYGGRIWVESKLGKGSDFYFTLPRISYQEAQELENKDKAKELAPVS